MEPNGRSQLVARGSKLAFHQLFPYPLQLAVYRAIVDGAAYLDYGAAEERWILLVAGAHLLAGQTRDLGFYILLFRIAQRPGARNMRIGEAEAIVQFLFDLPDDLTEQWQAAVIGDHSDEISHGARGADLLYDRIEDGSFLLAFDRRIFHHAAERIAFCQKRFEGVQFLRHACRVGVARDDYIDEGSGVNSDDGSHLLAVLSGTAIAAAWRLIGGQFGGEVADQHLIGAGIDVDLLARERDGEIGGVG